MKRLSILILCGILHAQTDPAYRVFRGDGTPSSLDEIVGKLDPGSVLFLGELHDDPTAHTLETELLKRVHARGPAQLSLEMFERDVQYVLDEYLSGLITEEHLISSGRAWRNYKADYKPMIEFAKENRLPVVAANAPRRYVNVVSRLGAAALLELPATAKASLPPLPYSAATEAYALKFNTFMEKMQKESEAEAAKSKSTTPAPPPRKIDPVKNLAAQSLWDASMAHSIAEALMRHPARFTVHVNGGFHSENRLGILDHLTRYRPGTKMIVVTMLYNKAFPDWDAEFASKGDFVILTDPGKVKKETPPAPKPAEAKPAAPSN